MSEVKENELIIDPVKQSRSHWQDDQNIETRNTILERVGGGLISFDALTDEGWLRGIAIECGEDVREQLIDTFEQSKLRWRKPKTASLIFPSHVRAIETHPDEDHLQDRAWVDSSEIVLARLEDTNANEDDYNETVLFAETVEFGPEEIPRLLNSLGQFISKNRCSIKEKTIVSLGAAIRKFAMNMPEDRFDGYASWLSPGETTYLDHRVELELVQGISWRLTFVPCSIGSVPHQMIETLQEIASQYASPRFIVQKNYAATAVEATVALVLLRILTDSTNEAKQLMEGVCKLDRDWFNELVTDQLHETAGHVAGDNQPLSDAILQVLAVVD